MTQYSVFFGLGFPRPVARALGAEGCFTGLFKRVEGEAPDPTEPGWNSGGADAYRISRPIAGPQSLLIVDLFIATIAKMAIDAIKRTRATALAI